MNATEALILVTDNDRPAYERLRGIALRCFANRLLDARFTDGIWTQDQVSVCNTADEAKAYIGDILDDVSSGAWSETKNCLVAQFVSLVFDEIDWHGVARHYLSKVGVEVKP